MSPEEIAARESVKLPTVLKSIDRMKAHAAEFSAESAELATREVYMRNLGEAAAVLQRALTATTTRATSKLVRRYDTLTDSEYEEAVVVDEVIPDIPLQLKGQEALQRLLASVQPKQPIVTVDARSQTNVGVGQGGLGGVSLGQGAGQPLALSAEAIIRQVRAERGLALPSGQESGTTLVAATLAPLIERDIELEEEEEEPEDVADGDREVEAWVKDGAERGGVN